jgi:hypothetical protein
MNLRPKHARRSGIPFLRAANAMRAAAVLAIVVAGGASSGAQDATPGAPDAAPVSTAGPIAIVPVDSGATVTGSLQVTSGKTLIAVSGSVTSADKTTEVVLPRRGVLRVCASTTVKLAADSSVPESETPGLMMSLDHGAVEASFATAKNSDILLTPDFRILIGGPGAAEVKVRLGPHGDTCVDNPGQDAPYVLVTSVFDGGVYRVQPGQRVMFQHGSLQEVVDQEKESCGCPSTPKPGSNEFPAAQSAGLAPLAAPAASPAAASVPAPVDPGPSPAKQTPTEPLIYQAPAAQPAPNLPSPSKIAQPSPVPAPAKPAKPGFFHRVGSFFKHLFGAE